MHFKPWWSKTEKTQHLCLDWKSSWRSAAYLNELCMTHTVSLTGSCEMSNNSPLGWAYPEKSLYEAIKGAFWFETTRHLVCMLEGVDKGLFRICDAIGVKFFNWIGGSCLVMVEHSLLFIFTFPWAWDVLVNYQRRSSFLSQRSYIIIYFLVWLVSFVSGVKMVAYIF